MRLAFTKMHGCGNDFVVLDRRDDPLEPEAGWVSALGDRRRGVGFDQLVLLGPGDAGADAGVRFFNPDGGEAGACGNGTRCAAALLFERTGVRAPRLRTAAGVLAAECLPDGRVRVDLGRPRLGWAEVPMAAAADTLRPEGPWPEGLGTPAALSMGNPHVTFFVPELGGVDMERQGPALEHDGRFPERVNVGFARVLSPERLRLRVWERGAGLTLACGTGACAAAVNAARLGLTGRRVTVEADGGVLEVEWDAADRVWLTGPAVTSFSGAIELSDGVPAGAPAPAMEAAVG